MDMGVRAVNECSRMESIEITENDIKNSIHELKCGKAAGPDKLKPKYFKK